MRGARCFPSRSCAIDTGSAVRPATSGSCAIARTARRGFAIGRAGLVPARTPHPRTRSLCCSTLVVIIRPGSQKLLRILSRKHPAWEWPARSTVCDLLLHHGLVPKTRRRPPWASRSARHSLTGQNRSDRRLQGQFRTETGLLLPAAVADGYSRFLLGCRALDSTSHGGARPVFRQCSRVHLPRLIRTDNGCPSPPAPWRVCPARVWWIRLGIYPEPSSPVTRAERSARAHASHLRGRDPRPPPDTSPASSAASAPSATINNHRPPEALGQDTPASRYRPSPRPFPTKPPALEYPSHYETRLVSRNGGIRWSSQWVNVSHVLGGEYVGLEDIDDGIWDVYFGRLKLARFHERTMRLVDALGRSERRRLLPMSPD